VEHLDEMEQEKVKDASEVVHLYEEVVMDETEVMFDGEAKVELLAVELEVQVNDEVEVTVVVE
jgi:hypothetical protein